MKLKKKVLAAALGAMMVSGAASAVSVNGNAVGDLLIAPAYMVGGGWKTEFKVINTDQTNSVVAKVVVHRSIDSREVLDFMLYLSPADAWSGTLTCTNPDCSALLMTSDDDSVLQLNSTNFATSALPARYPSTPSVVVTPNGPVTIPVPYGYVTITESSIYALAPNRPGVSKGAIRAAHEADTRGVLTDVQAIASTPSVLTGLVTLSNPLNGQLASIPMKAISDYHNKVRLVVNKDSPMGLNSVASLSDVEDALWANNFAVPYTILEGSAYSFASITYPTKLTYRGSNGGQYPFALSTPTAVSTVCLSPTIVYDMSENSIGTNISPLPQPVCTLEQEWLTMGNGKQINTGLYSTGWANINFGSPQVSIGQTSAPSQNIGKVGAPGIVTYINTSGPQITWNYAPFNN